VDLFHQLLVGLPGPGRPRPVGQPGDQHRQQSPRTVDDLQVDAGVRLDVQADTVPHQLVPAGPRRKFLIGARGLAGVVGGEVVAVGQRQQRDPGHRYPGGVQPPHHPGAFVAEVRAHQRHPRVERQQVIDDRSIGEQLYQPGGIQLARERQAGRREHQLTRPRGDAVVGHREPPRRCFPAGQYPA
jgi:hypothetical protein